MQSWRVLYSSISDNLGVFKEVLREYIYENTGLKVIALLVSLVLWGAVAKKELALTTLTDVPIEYVNLSNGFVIANDDCLKTATLRLRGQKDLMEPLRADMLVIKIDLATTKPGERVLPLSQADVVLPANINAEVLNIEPQRTRLTIEPLVERQVKVVPKFSGNVPEDYEATSISLNPSTIKIRGPESRVNALADVSTETIALVGHRTNFLEQVNIDIKDPKIYIVDSATIELQVQVGQIRVERRIDNVPLRVPTSSDKVTLNPVYVSVTLEGLKSVVESLDPGDVSANVDINNVPDMGLATPHINLPPNAFGGLTIKKIEPEQVQVKHR